VADVGDHKVVSGDVLNKKTTVYQAIVVTLNHAAEAVFGTYTGSIIFNLTAN
jgi:hypothetical protein